MDLDRQEDPVKTAIFIITIPLYIYFIKMIYQIYKKVNSRKINVKQSLYKICFDLRLISDKKIGSKKGAVIPLKNLII